MSDKKVDANTMVQALHEVSNHMQMAYFKYETALPRTRSEVIRTSQEKLADIGALVGEKSKNNLFRLALIDLASYLTYTASLCADKLIDNG